MLDEALKTCDKEYVITELVISDLTSKVFMAAML